MQLSSSSVLNANLLSSAQEPQPDSRAQAAVVLTIPSPTSSQWAALPSPWPHLWSSPATPCITAVKTRTPQRPLQPPHPPCMTRDPQPLPVELLSTTLPPTLQPWLILHSQPKPIYQNQCRAGTPSPCSSTTFYSVQSTRYELYKRSNTRIRPDSCLANPETSFTPSPPGTATHAQLRCTAVITYPPPGCSPFLLSQSLHSPYLFFLNVKMIPECFPQYTCCQIPASVLSHNSPHLCTTSSLKCCISVVGHY